MKEPTNADLQASFEKHAQHDLDFQNETRKTDLEIQDTLQLILNKLDPHHEDYINRNSEERLGMIEAKMEPLLQIYDGFIFGGKAVKYTAGIIGALGVIIASILATIKYLK